MASVTTIPRFDPPGFPYVDDGLTDQQREGWSAQIASWMNTEITAKQPDGEPLPGPGNSNRTPLTQFFNGTVTPYDVSQKPIAITWIGFPKLVADRSNTDKQRWQEADSTRDVQDEYLEWSVQREGDRVKSVTFTCEGPEYWEFFAESQPDKLDALYRAMNPDFKDQMKDSDWWSGKEYNRLNRWNDSTTTGSIAHLVQPNNTLEAEVDIAAQGTVIRKDGKGHIITDKTKLINCSAYGQPARNSDPTIGDGINGLARKGTSVSIANPVAIYMHSFNTANFMLDADGSGDNLESIPAGTFTWQRGDSAHNMGLRLRIKIPDGVMGTGDNEGRQLDVSDIVDTKTSDSISYGAQFADYITMTVKGVGISGGQPAEPLECPRRAAQGVVAEGVVAVQGLVSSVACDASKGKPRRGTRM